jgi:hypothetical protein
MAVEVKFPATRQDLLNAIPQVLSYTRSAQLNVPFDMVTDGRQIFVVESKGDNPSPREVTNDELAEHKDLCEEFFSRFNPDSASTPIPRDILPSQWTQNLTMSAEKIRDLLVEAIYSKLEKEDRSLASRNLVEDVVKRRIDDPARTSPSSSNPAKDSFGNRSGGGNRIQTTARDWIWDQGTSYSHHKSDPQIRIDASKPYDDVLNQLRNQGFDQTYPAILGFCSCLRRRAGRTKHRSQAGHT